MGCPRLLLHDSCSIILDLCSGRNYRNEIGKLGAEALGIDDTKEEEGLALLGKSITIQSKFGYIDDRRG